MVRVPGNEFGSGLAVAGGGLLIDEVLCVGAFAAFAEEAGKRGVEPHGRRSSKSFTIWASLWPLPMVTWSLCMPKPVK